MPWVYYAFGCHIAAKALYILLATIAAVLIMIFCFKDSFCDPRFRELRAKIFTGFGLSYALPVLHAFTTTSYVTLESFALCVWVGLCYILGAVLYALRIPERLHPGKFDYFLHSHQIFHVLVILAALAHYVNITHIYNLHQSNKSSCYYL